MRGELIGVLDFVCLILTVPNTAGGLIVDSIRDKFQLLEFD